MLDHRVDVTPGTPFDGQALPTHGGVWLAADEHDRPVMLAGCQNLRRVVTHRLTMPDAEEPSRRTNLAEVTRRIYWRGTFSRFETELMHWRAARILFPRDYRDRIAFGPCWFLRMDPAAAFPRFEPARTLRADSASYFGPFARRADADEWLHLLEDLFDLCRYHEVLEQTPHGQACAYFEMGKCPAPCDGAIPFDEYRRMMSSAAAFCAGDRSTHLEQLRAAMRDAAGALAFERAAAIRQTVERAEAAIARPAHRFVSAAPAWRWLVLQRGGRPSRVAGRAWIKPFFVRAGMIEEGDRVRLSELDGTLAGWIERCRAVDTAPADEPPARSEGLWLLAKYLFQGDRAPGLFLRLEELTDRAALLTRAASRFETPVSETEGAATGE